MVYFYSHHQEIVYLYLNLTAVGINLLLIYTVLSDQLGSVMRESSFFHQDSKLALTFLAFQLKDLHVKE